MLVFTCVIIATVPGTDELERFGVIKVSHPGRDVGLQVGGGGR
jgi:hypothetical protein